MWVKGLIVRLPWKIRTPVAFGLQVFFVGNVGWGRVFFNAHVWGVCSHFVDSTKIVKSAGASKVCRKHCVQKYEKLPQAKVSKYHKTLSAADSRSSPDTILRKHASTCLHTLCRAASFFPSSSLIRINGNRPKRIVEIIQMDFPRTFTCFKWPLSLIAKMMFRRIIVP